MARIMIDGKELGIHAIIVQIRSLEDFTPMPGSELGDVGYLILRTAGCAWLSNRQTEDGL